MFSRNNTSSGQDEPSTDGDRRTGEGEFDSESDIETRDLGSASRYSDSEDNVEYSDELTRLVRRLKTKFTTIEQIATVLDLLYDVRKKTRKNQCDQAILRTGLAMCETMGAKRTIKGYPKTIWLPHSGTNYSPIDCAFVLNKMGSLIENQEFSDGSEYDEIPIETYWHRLVEANPGVQRHVGAMVSAYYLRSARKNPIVGIMGADWKLDTKNLNYVLECYYGKEWVGLDAKRKSKFETVAKKLIKGKPVEQFDNGSRKGSPRIEIEEATTQEVNAEVQEDVVEVLDVHARLSALPRVPIKFRKYMQDCEDGNKPTPPNVRFDGNGPIIVYTKQHVEPLNFKLDMRGDPAAVGYPGQAKEKDWNWRNFWTIVSSVNPKASKPSPHSGWQHHPLCNAVRNEAESQIYQQYEEYGTCLDIGSGHSVLRLQALGYDFIALDPSYAKNEPWQKKIFTPYFASRLECVKVEIDNEVGRVNGKMFGWVHLGNSYWHLNGRERKILERLAMVMPVIQSGAHIKTQCSKFQDIVNPTVDGGTIRDEAYWSLHNKRLSFTVDSQYVHRYSMNNYTEILDYTQWNIGFTWEMSPHFCYSSALLTPRADVQEVYNQVTLKPLTLDYYIPALKPISEVLDVELTIPFQKPIMIDDNVYSELVRAGLGLELTHAEVANLYSRLERNLNPDRSIEVSDRIRAAVPHFARILHENNIEIRTEPTFTTTLC